LFALFVSASTLDLNAVRWMMYRAFFLRLSIVQSYYRHVLRNIDWMLKRLSQRIPDEECDQMKQLTLRIPDAFKTVS
jgi:hypothetical protein